MPRAPLGSLPSPFPRPNLPPHPPPHPLQGYLLEEYHDGYWLGLNATGSYGAFQTLDPTLGPSRGLPYRHWGEVLDSNGDLLDVRPDNLTGGCGGRGRLQPPGLRCALEELSLAACWHKRANAGCCASVNERDSIVISRA